MFSMIVIRRRVAITMSLGSGPLILRYRKRRLPGRGLRLFAGNNLRFRNVLLRRETWERFQCSPLPNQQTPVCDVIDQLNWTPS